MVDQFFASLSGVSPVLPLLVRGLFVAIVVILLWVVLSVPAFWLCRAVGMFLTSALARLSEVQRQLFASAGSLFRSHNASVSRFVEAHAQMFSFAHENKQISANITKLQSAVEGIPNRLRELASSVSDAGNKLAAASDGLAHVESQPPLQAPSPQEFSAIRIARNRAAVTLVVALILTPAFIGFNTGMLNEFLDGFWPGLDYLGLPLSLILAGFATLLEIALGAFLVLFPSRPAQLLWYIGLLLLAFVELSFYARLGQGFNWSLFDAFYPNGAAPAYTKLWFGVIGPVLVLCLAGAGHALFSSISTLSDSHVLRQWRAHIKARMRHATQLKNRIGEADRAKELLSAGITDVQNHLAVGQRIGNSSLSIMDNAKQQLIDELRRAAAIRMEDTRRLDRGAMLRQFIECLFLAAAITFSLILIALLYSSFDVVTPVWWLAGVKLGWAVALGQMVLLFGAGSAISRANATLPAVDGIPATNLTQSTIAPAIGIGILMLVVLGDGFFFVRLPHPVSLMWFVLATAADVFLFWCGTKLGMIGAAVWAAFQSFLCVFAATCMGFSALVVGLVRLTLAGLRMLLVVVAYPYSVLLLRDATGTRLFAWAGT